MQCIDPYIGVTTRDLGETRGFILYKQTCYEDRCWSDLHAPALYT